MKFHDYKTELQLVLEDMNVTKPKTEAELDRLYSLYVKYMASKMPADDLKYVELRNELEKQWVKCGRPYYKIWPDYVAMLCNTSLNIPVGTLNVPSHVICVRFADGHEPVYAGIKMRAFLFSKLQPLEASEVSVFVVTAYCYGKNVDSKNEKCNESWIQFEMFSRNSDTFDAVLEAEFIGGNTSKAFACAASIPIMRMAVAISFLATSGSRYMDPDILNEDFRKYLKAVNEANTAEVERLTTKARTTYKRSGFILGRREYILGKSVYRVGKERSAPGTGSKRQYRHIRNAHIHRYWETIEEYNTWERLVPRFQSMIIVRPDLPQDPREKGYRTLRCREEMNRGKK